MTWAMKTLGEIGEWGSGGTPLSSRPEYYNGAVPWLIIEDLNDGRVTSSQRTITELGLKNSSAKMVAPGTLLIAMYGSIGKLGIAGISCATNQAIAFCRCNPGLVDVCFLFYYLLSSREKLLGMGKGNTQQNIGQEVLKEFQVPLPSLAEQHGIAGLLSRADRLRRLGRYAENLGGSVLQSVFLEMFGNPNTNSKRWPAAKFSDVCESRLGKMLDEKRQTGRHLRPYLRNVNVQWSSVDLSDVAQMDFDEKDRAEFRLKYGDVLICEGGEVGRSAIWHDELQECYFQKALHRARPNAQLALPEYIVWLMFMMARNGGLGDSTSQVTIAHLTGEKLKELTIQIPPLAAQAAFAAVVRRVQALKARARESARQGEELFQALLAQSFGAGKHAES